MTPWTYIWDSLSSSEFSIFGVKSADVREWTYIKGEIAEVVDPIYGAICNYPVYERTFEGKGIVRMAYREHSPGVYLAFLDDPIAVESVEPKPSRVIICN